MNFKKTKEMIRRSIQNKNSSGDEIPERGVTYYLIRLLIYHCTRHTCTSGIFV